MEGKSGNSFNEGNVEAKSGKIQGEKKGYKGKINNNKKNYVSHKNIYY